MRRGFFFSSLLITAATGVSLYFYITAPASRAITGYVYSKNADGRREASQNTEIDLWSDDGSDAPILKTTTNELGWFSFPELKNSHYKISAQHASSNYYTLDTTEVSRGATYNLKMEGPWLVCPF
ncbi:MAG: hypothetical protein HY286_10955 [Planctomycetes bacterium]|nr:hypothetical protein [Planctomycetota bacterium]